MIYNKFYQLMRSKFYFCISKKKLIKKEFSKNWKKNDFTFIMNLNS